MKPSQNIEITVDAVVFGYSKEEKVSVLLVKRKYNPFKNKWAIPGGFLVKGESLEDAVNRELKEETGISINYLEQLYTFGNPERDPRNHIITVGYFGLVKTSKFKKLSASTDASEAKWYSINSLPELAFDHSTILQTAIERLRSKLQYRPIGFELLDKKFPFSDLEHLYMSLLNRPIDRRNFKKKIMAFGILDKLEEKTATKGAGRPGNLYQFNEIAYEKMIKKGFHFEI